jgi:hypothetical protein
MAKTTVPVDQYDPNLAPATSRLYGVYDGHAFHVTAVRATAIQKVYARSTCSIWESVGGRWVRRGLKNGWPDQGEPCGHCQRPLQVTGRGYYTHCVDGKWCFTRGQNRKILDPLELLFLCPDCVAFNES